MEAYDIITVGSGHNALVAAALLARAGNRVLVLERNDRPGGFVRTGESEGTKNFHHRDTEDTKLREGGKLVLLIWGTRMTIFPPCTPFPRLGALEDFIVVFRRRMQRKCEMSSTGGEFHHQSAGGNNRCISLRASCPLCLFGEIPSVAAVGKSPNHKADFSYN